MKLLIVPRWRPRTAVRDSPSVAGDFTRLTIRSRSHTIDGMSLTVDVRLGARLGPGRRRVTIPAGATVADVLAKLAPDLGRTEQELAGVAVALRGEVVGHDHALNDG